MKFLEKHFGKAWMALVFLFLYLRSDWVHGFEKKTRLTLQ